MKEGDSTGEVQGVNEAPQTSLAAAILKGMDVLQGTFIARNKHWNVLLIKKLEKHKPLA